ncbi:hypothetical protein KCP75_13105 [Salmonella enterica subsp. enterica]|nr:hypothetical protein KCP75_13105 [Salmonella enterica subsp. enterica]
MTATGRYVFRMTGSARMRWYCAIWKNSSTGNDWRIILGRKLAGGSPRKLWTRTPRRSRRLPSSLR